MTLASLPAIERMSAFFGALLWVSLGLSPQLDLIHWLLLLGPLVAVPLGLGLVIDPLALPCPRITSPSPSQILRWARRTQPFGALAAVVAVVAPWRSGSKRWPPELDGPDETLFLVLLTLALLWLSVTVLVAFCGLQRILDRLGAGRLDEIHELSVDMGLLYLPVGGAWLTAACLGWEPLGFTGDIVPLTGVHFHFAGFTAPILVGLTGRSLVNHPSDLVRRAATVACLGAIVGPPLVAAGITFSRLLELPGAAILATCLLTSSVLNVSVVRRTFPSPAARGWLNLSSASLFVTMSLAVLYAFGRTTGVEMFPISFMARFHGTGNALGFAIPGLIAWNITTAQEAESQRLTNDAAQGDGPRIRASVT